MTKNIGMFFVANRHATFPGLIGLGSNTKNYKLAMYVYLPYLDIQSKEALKSDPRKRRPPHGIRLIDILITCRTSNETLTML